MKRGRTLICVFHRGILCYAYLLALFLVGMMGSRPVEARPFAYVTNFNSDLSSSTVQLAKAKTKITPKAITNPPVEKPKTSEEERQNLQLREAALKGDITQVQNLLAKGADVQASDKNGATALIVAAWKGHADIVQALLAKGADVNAHMKEGATALIVAAQNGHTAIVETLLAKGADRDTAALILAAQNGHTAIVEALLAKGADANARSTTALILAAQNGHTAIVEALLAKGADVNASYGGYGLTALMLAAEYG